MVEGLSCDWVKYNIWPGERLMWVCWTTHTAKWRDTNAVDAKLKIFLSCRTPSVKSMIFQVFSLSQKWSHRIGSLGDGITNLLEHVLCSSPNSRIGFGGGGSGYENAWGKRALWRVDNGDKNIKAFGYIFLYLSHWTTNPNPKLHATWSNDHALILVMKF